MRASRQLLAALPIIVAVAACSPSASATATASAVASAAPSAASQAPASASAAPSASASAAPSSQAPSSAPAASGPTAAPTALDPCQLVTRSEATSLAGMQLGAGQELTNTNNTKTCTYGVTGNEVVVFLVQAPNQAALDAGKAQALAEIQKAASNGIKATQISGIGDDAALMTMSHTTSGVTINVIGIDVVKGLTFFAITDVSVGHAVASEAAIKAQAQTTLTRIP